MDERFTTKFVVMDSGCWEWTAAVTGGYGVFARPRAAARALGVRRMVQAHRYAYEESIGPIPPGLVIDHLCRNQLCVNPEHLEPVTSQENWRRGAGVGMSLWDGAPIPDPRRTASHCKHGHEYTPENTYYDPKGSNHRRCRECSRENGRRKYWRTTVHKRRPHGDHTRCVHGHEMTPENTYVNGTRKDCRLCANANQRAYQARKKAAH